MSGDSTTITGMLTAGGVTPDATTAPDATIPNVSAGAEGAPADTPGQGASHADMLTQSEWTRRTVALASIVVVGLSVLAIVVTMCHRVWIDGNAPLTGDITTKLMWIALGGLASMVGALFGSNAVLGKMIDKLP